MRFSSPVFQIKAGGSNGEFTGYLSAFNVLDSHGDIVRPGAFTKTLERHKARGTRPALLWAHDIAEPIGGWVALSEDSKGLYGEGRLELSTKRGADSYALMRHDFVGLSIGFYPVNTKPTSEGRADLLELDLVEASVVSIPSNPEARITGVKSRPKDPRECEDALRSLGYSNKEARRFISGGWSAMVKAGSDEALAAELVAKINSISNSI